jgi:hypothetical protein
VAAAVDHRSIRKYSRLRIGMLIRVKHVAASRPHTEASMATIVKSARTLRPSSAASKSWRLLATRMMASNTVSAPGGYSTAKSV